MDEKFYARGGRRRRGLLWVRGWWVMAVMWLLVLGEGREVRGQCPRFATAVNYVAGTSPRFIVVGDFNGDTIPDLAVSGSGMDVSILLGHGDGTFGVPTTVPIGSIPRVLLAADLNGDGRTDLLTVNQSGNSVVVLLRTGLGAFSAPTAYSVGTNPVAACVADLDGDGKIDVATANYGSSTISILRGVCDGTFALEQHFFALSYPDYVAAGDVNQDGRTDLIVSNALDGRFTVFWNAGGTNFLRLGFIPLLYPYTVVTGDFNRDGKLDFVASASSCCPKIFKGLGGGAFDSGTSFFAGQLVGDPAVGDINGDGILDLAVPGSFGLGVVLGTGTGTFLQPEISAADGAAVKVALADFNRDGKLDAAVINESGGVLIFLNLPTRPRLVVTRQPVSAIAVIGASVEYSVAETSPITDAYIRFRWRKDGVNLQNGPTSTGSIVAGATSEVFTISNISPADGGFAYDCVVTDDCGSVQSNAAGLRVMRRCVADVNETGIVDVQDVFDFLNAWLAGCP